MKRYLFLVAFVTTAISAKCGCEQEVVVEPLNATYLTKQALDAEQRAADKLQMVIDAATAYQRKLDQSAQANSSAASELAELAQDRQDVATTADTSARAAYQAASRVSASA